MTTRGWTPSDSSSRRGAVPAVVQPDLAHARLVQEVLPGAPVRLPLDRSAVDLSERQIAVFAQRPSRDAFLELRGAMRLQRADELDGQSQGSPDAGRQSGP
jgi:hypothetical protein